MNVECSSLLPLYVGNGRDRSERLEAGASNYTFVPKQGLGNETEVLQGLGNETKVLQGLGKEREVLRHRNKI